MYFMKRRLFIASPLFLMGSLSCCSKTAVQRGSPSSYRPIAVHDWISLMPAGQGQSLGIEWQEGREVLLSLDSHDTIKHPFVPFSVALRRLIKNAPPQQWEIQIRYIQIIAISDSVVETSVKGGVAFRSVQKAEALRLLSPGYRQNKAEDRLGIFQVTHRLTNEEVEQLKLASADFENMEVLLTNTDGQLISVEFDFYKFMGKFKVNSDKAPREVEKVFVPYYWRNFGIKKR
jgi:hypothetical protein